jgi:hypothetical protein
MRVRQTSTVVRWVVLAALTAATALMYAISLRGNYLYGYGLGQTPERRELFAWANVAADIWKGFGLVAVMLLWRAHKRMALVASLAWLVCLATGINSAIGVYVQDRATLTGTREGRRTSYQEVESELARILQRMQQLPPHRSVQEVEAAIAAQLAKPVLIGGRVRGTVGSLSGNCSKSDNRAAEDCAEVAKLRQELATAQEGQKLAAAAAQLRQRLETLRERGASLAPDPLGEFWAWATRGLVSVRDVGFSFPLAFALLIEIVSAFGPAVIVAVAAATRPDSLMQPAAARAIMLQPATAGPAGQVAQWLGDRTEPASAQRAVSLDELYGDYLAWCESRSLRAGAIDTFERELDDVRALPSLAGRIRKFGRRYYGLRLQHPALLVSPMDQP